jgi:hypothetical protein
MVALFWRQPVAEGYLPACAMCGERFEPRPRSSGGQAQRFCSRRCEQRSVQRRRVTRRRLARAPRPGTPLPHCQECHAELHVVTHDRDGRPTRKFCGKRCQMRDQRRRRKLDLARQIVAGFRRLRAA